MEKVVPADTTRIVATASFDSDTPDYSPVPDSVSAHIACACLDAFHAAFAGNAVAARNASSYVRASQLGSAASLDACA